MNFFMHGGKHHFTVETVTGRDWWALTFFPRRLALWYFARRIAKHQGVARGQKIPPGEITFSLPGESRPYSVLDGAGACTVYHRHAEAVDAASGSGS